MDHIVQDKLAAQTVSKQRLQVPRLPLHAHQMSKIMSNTQHMHFSALLMPSVLVQHPIKSLKHV